MISAKPLPMRGAGKPRRTTLTDPAEIAALTTSGRWVEGKPLTWKAGDTVYAQSEVLKTWREARAITGNRNRA